MENYKKGGLEKRFIIFKRDGSNVDSKADYFVLRLDKDPHAQKALITYMESVRADNEQLASDLENKLINEYGWVKCEAFLTEKIDWKALRKRYFNKCTYYQDGLRKVSLAPHDLFEWFKSNLIK